MQWFAPQPVLHRSREPGSGRGSIPVGARLRVRVRVRRRGMSILYMILIMGVLFGIVSFAVDYGRVQVVKTELQRAADSAALAGAGGLYDGTSVSRATNAASDNTVNGAPFQLASADVTTGVWSNGTFTAGAAPGNAVQVRAVLPSVPLMFGSLIGVPTRTVRAYATAVLPPANYGVVGINYISMTGNSSMSYWSPDGTTNTSQHGSIASNGSISLSGNTMIYGDARPGVGQSIVGAAGRVTGTTQALTTAMSFPNANAGSYQFVNDNNQVPQISAGWDLNIGGSTTLSIPGGTYYLHDLTIAPQATLICTGPVTMYIYHNVNISGTTVTASSLPRNLKIIVCPDKNGNPPGPVSVSASSSFFTSIYAPQSPVTLSGTGDIYGSVLGQSVSMTGTSNIHYDLALTGGTGVAALVK